MLNVWRVRDAPCTLSTCVGQSLAAGVRTWCTATVHHLEHNYAVICKHSRSSQREKCKGNIAATTTCMLHVAAAAAFNAVRLRLAGGWQQLQHSRRCCGSRLAAGKLHRACAVAPDTPPLVFCQGMLTKQLRHSLTCSKEGGTGTPAPS
jgi:hypothetical protein